MTRVVWLVFLFGVVFVPHAAGTGDVALPGDPGLTGPLQSQLQSQEVRIQFRKSNLVRGADYTLGDVASIQSSDAERERRLACLVLGRSPALGRRIMLNPRLLEMSLERLGVADEASVDYPERIFLQREVQDLDMEALRKRIVEEIRKELPFEGQKAVVEKVLLPRSLRMPAGAVSFKIDFRVPRRGVGSVSFRVDVLIDGLSVRKLSGSLHVDLMVPVLKVGKNVARSELIRPDLVNPTTIRLSEVRGIPVQADELRLALRTRRNLAPGDLLTWYNVEREILVRRGQTVRLVLQRAGIRISTLGKARTKGALGDLVEAVNTRTGKKLRGYVVDRNTIRVLY